MGELTFIKAGIATTIRDNGDVTSAPADRCDSCHELRDGSTGLSIRDLSGEVTLWLCQECS